MIRTLVSFLRERIAIVLTAIAMFIIGGLSMLSLPLVFAAGTITNVYACVNNTTLVPRIVTSTGSCTPVIEHEVSWQAAPESGTANPFVCGACIMNGITRLSGRDLTGAWIVNSEAENSDFSNTNFTDADLTMADFYGADFHGANFTNADLTSADLTSAVGMASATVSGVTWSGTHCPDGTNSNDDGGTCVGHF